MTDSRVHVVVDDRENGVACSPAALAGRRGVMLTTDRLSLGYDLVDDWLRVERKTLSDLAGAIAGGRWRR
jgi:ERCC4-type nuclease